MFCYSSFEEFYPAFCEHLSSNLPQQPATRKLNTQHARFAMHAQDPVSPSYCPSAQQSTDCPKQPQKATDPKRVNEPGVKPLGPDVPGPGQCGVTGLPDPLS